MDGRKLLREALAARQWSQGELERQLDLSDSAVGRWVRGERRPGVNAALQLQRVLGIPVEAWAHKNKRGHKRKARKTVQPTRPTSKTPAQPVST